MSPQQVDVTVNYGDNQQIDVSLPLQVQAKEIAEALARSLDVVTGKPRVYTLEILLTTGSVRIPPRITLGDARVLCGSCLQLDVEKEASADTGSGEACLLNSEGSRITLHGSQWTIGRSDIKRGILVDIDLSSFAASQSVSRRHAQIQLTPQGYQIQDLGSTNGTFVNGERLAGSTPRLLHNSDALDLGKQGTRLFFKVEETDESDSTDQTGTKGEGNIEND